ncbi:MAG: tyrosine-protein phosphatase [Bdellovibrionota bacterium]
MLKNPALFILALALSLNAQATYQALPSSEEKTCPSHGQFFQDHFCWLGATASQSLSCVACPVQANDESSRIIRGGEPSAAGVSALKKIGVRLIIDLRTNAEVHHGTEPKDADSNAIAYFHVPMDTGSSNLAQKNEEALFHALGLVRFFLKENKTGLVYFHCQRGEDRTGLFAAAIRLILEGRDRSEVRKEMSRHYFNDNYAALRDVWDRLRVEDSSKITEPTPEEQDILRKT